MDCDRYGINCYSSIMLSADTVVEVDLYCLDVLLRDLVGHDRKPSAYVLYLYLFGQARGKEAVRASLNELAECTGLAKRSVQDGLACLSRRGLLSLTRETATSVPTIHVNYPWRRSRRR
jgi:hypothetical protein